MSRSLGGAAAVLALGLATACTGHQHAAVSVPVPDLSKFLHVNYTVTSQFTLRGDKSHPESVVVVSSGPGLTPDAPVQGGTQDVQVLSFDPIVKRWNLALDAASKIVSAEFLSKMATDPVTFEASALLPQDHMITDTTAQVVAFQPGETSLVIYGVDDYYNHPPGVLGIVNLVNGPPQVTYYDTQSNLSGLKVTGKPGTQRLMVSASFSAPGDPGCCPVRNYTQIIASTDSGHTSPPSVGVVEDDRPWLGAYVTSDPTLTGPVAVVGTAANTVASTVLHVGDRILGVVGERPPAGSSNTTPVFDVIGLHKPSDRITLLVQRSGKQLQLPVTLGSRNDPGFDLQGSKQASLGVQVSKTPLGSNPSAVVITGFATGSAARTAGLEIGETITQVGDLPVHDPLDLIVALWGHAFQPVAIQIIQPDGQRATGSITPTQDDPAVTADPL